MWLLIGRLALGDQPAGHMEGRQLTRITAPLGKKITSGDLECLKGSHCAR